MAGRSLPLQPDLGGHHPRARSAPDPGNLATLNPMKPAEYVAYVAEEALARGPRNAPFSVPFLIKDIGMHYANIPHHMRSRFADGLAIRERGAESRGGGAHGVLPLPPRSFAIRAGKFWMMTIRDAWLKPTIAKV